MRLPANIRIIRLEKEGLYELHQQCGMHLLLYLFNQGQALCFFEFRFCIRILGLFAFPSFLRAGFRFLSVHSYIFIDTRT